MKKRRISAVKPLLALLFWTGVWYLAAVSLGKPLLLPTPYRVLRCLVGLMGTASFWQTTAVTLGRILLGTMAAVALGLVLAVVTAASSLIRALVEPVMTVIQASPVASFAILVLIWMDRDYVPALICAMMVLPVVWNNVCTGIRQTDVQLLEMAKVYRLTPVQVLRRIYVPSVLPYFRAACSSGLGLGWKAGVAAEVLTVPKLSIGRMISESKMYLMTEELFAWTLAVIGLSLLLQRLMMLVLKGRGDHAET